MGFRFRQRIKVLPGVYLNLTGKGVSSVSIGGPGTTVNVNKSMRVTGTVGLPGTGLSYREVIHPGKSGLPRRPQPAKTNGYLEEPRRLETLLTESPHSGPGPNSWTGASWTSETLAHLQSKILAAHKERSRLACDTSAAQVKLANAEKNCSRLNTWFYRWFRKGVLREALALRETRRSELRVATEALNEQLIDIDWEHPKPLTRLYEEFAARIRKTAQVAKLWHVAARQQIDRVSERTLHGAVIERCDATLSVKRVPFMAVRSGAPFEQVPSLATTSGLALYFFPSFVAVLRGNELGLVSPSDVMFDLDSRDVVEPDLPAGAQVTGQTWTYVNKDGSPDGRYNDNHAVPIATYDQLRVTAGPAFDEEFLFTRSAADFADWMPIRDWFVNAGVRGELESLPIVPAEWAERREDDANYIATGYLGKEVVGFGIPHQGEQVWICLSVSHLGIQLPVDDMNVTYWLDETPLTLCSGGQLSAESTAHRIFLGADEDRTTLFNQLCSAEELFVSVMDESTPILQLRFSLEGFAQRLDAAIGTEAQ